MFTVQYRSVGISQSCFVTWWFQRALNAAGLVAHRAMATTFHFDGEFVRAQEHEAEGIVLYDPRQHSSLALLYGEHPTQRGWNGDAASRASVFVTIGRFFQLARLEDRCGPLLAEHRHPVGTARLPKS